MVYEEENIKKRIKRDLGLSLVVLLGSTRAIISDVKLSTIVAGVPLQPTRVNYNFLVRIFEINTKSSY